MNKRQINWLDPEFQPTSEDIIVPDELKDHYDFLLHRAKERTEKDPILKNRIIEKFDSIEKWAFAGLKRVEEHLKKDFDLE